MAYSTWNNLIFDYLNNNQHKFDEHGNFDSTPDERDYWPFVFASKQSKPPKPRKPKYSGQYRQGEGPDDVAKQRTQYALDDFEKGIRYDGDKCNDNWQLEKKLCKDGNYTSGCWTRADDRNKKCISLGHYDGLPIWTYDEEVSSPEELDKRKKKSGSNAQPNPEPEKKPDKSEFSLESMFTNLVPNTLETWLAMSPALWAVVDPDGMQSKTNQMLRNFVMMPSDYPRQMRPSSAWAPQPFHYTWMNAMPMPLPRGAGLGVSPPVPR